MFLCLLEECVTHLQEKDMEFFNLIIVTVFSILKARKGLIPHFNPKSKLFQSFEIYFNSGINHFFKKKADYWKIFWKTLNENTVIWVLDNFKIQAHLAPKKCIGTSYSMTNQWNIKFVTHNNPKSQLDINFSHNIKPSRIFYASPSTWDQH